MRGVFLQLAASFGVSVACLVQPMARAQSPDASARAPQVNDPSSPAANLREHTHGGEVFQYWCSNCHGAGPGHPGTTALQAKYHGTPPALLEERTDLNAATVKFYVRHGLSIMPMFRKTEISDADLNELAAYLAKSNG